MGVQTRDPWIMTEYFIPLRLFHTTETTHPLVNCNYTMYHLHATMSCVQWFYFYGIYVWFYCICSSISLFQPPYFLINDAILFPCTMLAFATLRFSNTYSLWGISLSLKWQLWGCHFRVFTFCLHSLWSIFTIYMACTLISVGPHHLSPLSVQFIKHISYSLLHH